MHRNFILVFVLLVTLSMVNAAPYLHNHTKTVFDACITADGLKQPTFNVKIQPDPIEPGRVIDFTLSGSVPFDINEDVMIQIDFYDQLVSYPPVRKPHAQLIYTQPACKGIKGKNGKNGKNECLIKANTPFTLEAHKVPTSKRLRAPYIIDVKILHNSAKKESKISEACATAQIGLIEE